MLSNLADWVAAGAITLVVLLAVGALLAPLGPVGWTTGTGLPFRRARPPRDQFRAAGAPAQPRRHQAAIVVNPSKMPDPLQVRRQVTDACAQAGWADPLWLETSPEDPGTGQARAAVRQGVEMVCALGGDGTVRAVAAALVGTDTPMGLLPGGTGNLLARNLSLPVDSLEAALTTALNGRNKRVDVGTVNVTPPDAQDKAKDYIFLVMAGLGFDAKIMADAPEHLKKRIGWVAYSISGLKHLRGPRFKVVVSIDHGPTMHRRVRTVLVGNCGKLQGGLVLLPEAKLDDGRLDAVLLSPTGLVGWVAVLVRVLTKRRKGHQRVDHHQAQSVRIVCDRPETVQLDGDPIGEALELSIQVRPGGLLVRVA